ncbi:hypothetical protein M9H77_10997 [Catharanthus roseus]|uniref:Uncharacterized protein n=1 Tax=Catharanthus roseus TaxID=4058 RepID=A0ACC0BDC8_CATRO|nr:hypothetical protein M9H77_10997 [Catharanthus roseus]
MATRPSLVFLFVLLCFFLSSSSTVHSQSDEFVYNGFKHLGSNNLTLNGVSQIQNHGFIQLTNDTLRLLGHAFHSDAILFKNSTTGKVFSFSTAFAFAIVPEYEKLGGHGMAFVISPNKELKGALPSQYLGLLSPAVNGNFSNHLFAVEFDTVQDFEFNDISDNHVGIDLNSVVSNASVNASYYTDGNSTKQDLSLKSGKVIQAWIDYDSSKNELNVTLSPFSSKPSTSILSFHVDLSPYLEDYMYVGFSASTGLLSGSHYVFGWSFKMNGEAQSLDLSSLPSLPARRKNHLALISGVSISAAVLIVAGILLALFIIKKIKNMDVIEDWELDVGPHRFSYKELKKATKGFRDKELLGFGGFGRVYKGTLPNSNTQVAVKRINHESKQGLQEFVSEVASIGRLRHRNLVQLLGWCRRREDLMLVYDFMPNGSLDKYIFDEPKVVLTWEQRFKIIKGVASGLLYLHEGWEQTVIHRDIKAGNVLLDLELNGRLGDFGLAKLYEHGSNPSTTRVVGTLGYLAPELTKTGKPTTSSDVFAFGALLLEVVCGRRPIEPKALPEKLILVDWVWDRWKQGAILEVVDPRLGGEYNGAEVILVLKLGLMCSNNKPSKRPTMRQVLRYLEGEGTLPEVVAPPDEEEGKKSGDHGSEFEDFVHSYPPSSYFEKVSTWSSGDLAERDDLDAASSASPFSGRGESGWS